jgi:hypothetical protein
MTTQTVKPTPEPLLPLFLAWATYRLSERLAAMRPALTTEQAAAAAALSNNPTGS